MRVALRLTIAAAIAAASCVSTAAAGAAAPPLRPIDPPVRYAALGDSYAAGQGVPSPLLGATARCRRSTRSNPRLIEEKLELRVGTNTDDVVSLADRSCSGATGEHVLSPQWTGAEYVEPQITALPPDSQTDYVTFGFGANDVNLLGILNRCRYVAQSGLETCQQAHVRKALDPFADIGAAAGRLGAAIDAVEARTPHAVMLVVGYPSIVPPAGDESCFGALGVRAADMIWFDSIHRALNSALALQATTRGARFVDAYTRSLGHDACQSATVRWVEPAYPLSTASLHPNSKGQLALANAVVAKIFEVPAG